MNLKQLNELLLKYIDQVRISIVPKSTRWNSEKLSRITYLETDLSSQVWFDVAGAIPWVSPGHAWILHSQRRQVKKLFSWELPKSLKRALHQQIHCMHKTWSNINCQINTDIPRSEIDALHGQYSSQLSDWKARCEAAEAKYAAANVQVIINLVMMICWWLMMIMERPLRPSMLLLTFRWLFHEYDDHQLGHQDLLVIGKITFMMITIMVIMTRIKDFKYKISGGDTARAGEGGGKAASGGINQQTSRP